MSQDLDSNPWQDPIDSLYGSSKWSTLETRPSGISPTSLQARGAGHDSDEKNHSRIDGVASCRETHSSSTVRHSGHIPIPSANLAAKFETRSPDHDRHMNHPIPDLQTIQGAYTSNIERLEQHAERLSMSSDVDEELRKLRDGQKRSENRTSSVLDPSLSLSPPRTDFFSTGRPPTNISFSTTERNLPALTHILSPTVSVHHSHPNGAWNPDIRNHESPARSDHRSEHNDVFKSHRAAAHGNYYLYNSGKYLGSHLCSSESEGISLLEQHHDSTPSESWQNITSSSKVSSQQFSETSARLDRIIHHEQESKLDENESHSINQNDRAIRSLQIAEIPPSGTVFYPAPIPAVLSLPPRLSKERPAARINQTRSGILAKEQSENTTHHDEWSDIESSKEQKVSPLPHFRTSDQKSQVQISQDLQLQNGSATATLDALLDASVQAPVSAFTDHPIVGEVGAVVYGRATDPKSNSPPHDMALGVPDASSKSLDDDIALNPETSANDEAPATLLAELQMRKIQQRLRNKNAANALPHGMHSTLLQMDTVAQLQRENRKHKHVKLAWEELSGDQLQDAADENLPLALLKLQSNAQDLEDNQPLGILAQRQAEENEPLIIRRARLLGKPVSSQSEAFEFRQGRGNPALAVVDNPAEETNDDSEGETLAQRKRRLHVKEALSIAQGVSEDFTAEILDQLRVPADKQTKATKVVGDSLVLADGEETLAQRRARLRAERTANPLSVATTAENSSSQQRRHQTKVTIGPLGHASQPCTQPDDDPRSAMVDRWRQSVA